MNISKLVREKLGKSKRGSRLLEDIRYRTVILAVVSLIINIIYAWYNGIIGFLSHSVWFTAVSVYYMVLTAMRFAAVTAEQKKDIKKEYVLARYIGIMFIFLSLVLGGIVRMSVEYDTAIRYGTIVMITIATYTFYKITMAVIRAVKYRKENSPLIKAIRGIGYAEVAVSVFTMQMSMLVSFDGMSRKNILIFNLLTGTAVCIFIFLLGIAMIKNGRRKDF